VCWNAADLGASMSIIFGIRECEAKVEDGYLQGLARATDRFAPDGTFFQTTGRVGMGFQPFHTHHRSILESQPLVDVHGNMLTFDGRLDNQAEVSDLLKIRDVEASDSAIVLKAFERWGEDTFGRLIGDWAIALWCETDRSLYLARDHAGTRTLYFEQTKTCLLWSTFLETFFISAKQRDLDEDFAACYLACQPIRDLTPYKGIQAVPPAHFLKFRGNNIIRKAHWEWMANGKISYKTDREYEEHFRSLFTQAVEKRTGPGAPILAHLSGGMDSASIVCVSDHVRRRRGISTEDLLDTLSYYDDSEPSWNEKPYFTAVEAKRGKCGIHIETSFLNRSFKAPESPSGGFLLPGVDSGVFEQEQKFDAQIADGGYRVILSGIGGDEVLGGVPTPMPELGDLLVSGHSASLLRKAMAWSLVKRQPLFRTLFKTISFTVSLYRHQAVDKDRIPPWVKPHLRDRLITLEGCSELNARRLGLSPSAISNGLAWWSILETLPHLQQSVLARREYRYPYLDQDLVNFLFRLPREQMVRPGRRRSLMRRALSDIVPPEVLERRRKAFLLRGPIAALRASKTAIESAIAGSAAADYGWIAPDLLLQAIQGVTTGDPKWTMPIIKAIGFELWLRNHSSPPTLMAKR
jgi:asparagine synthase (glutamine-hydrolysing)